MSLKLKNETATIKKLNKYKRQLKKYMLKHEMALKEIEFV